MKELQWSHLNREASIRAGWAGILVGRSRLFSARFAARPFSPFRKVWSGHMGPFCTSFLPSGGRDGGLGAQCHRAHQVVRQGEPEHDRPHLP